MKFCVAQTFLIELHSPKDVLLVVELNVFFTKLVNK